MNAHSTAASPTNAQPASLAALLCAAIRRCRQLWRDAAPQIYYPPQEYIMFNYISKLTILVTTVMLTAIISGCSGRITSTPFDPGVHTGEKFTGVPVKVITPDKQYREYFYYSNRQDGKTCTPVLLSRIIERDAVEWVAVGYQPGRFGTHIFTKPKFTILLQADGTLAEASLEYIDSEVIKSIADLLRAKSEDDAGDGGGDPPPKASRFGGATCASDPVILHRCPLTTENNTDCDNTAADMFNKILKPSGAGGS